MLTQEQVMQELRDLGSVIKDLETEIKPLRNRRDRLAVRAMQMGVPENHVAIAASVSRGWTHTLKKRGGIVTRQYHDRRVTPRHIEYLEDRLRRARRVIERREEEEAAREAMQS